MESDKENMPSKPIKYTSNTRIPVPLEPLPLLPRHLIVKKIKQARAPLRTIDSTNANVASSSSQAQKTNKEPKKIKKEVNFKKCVRHVITYSNLKNDWAQLVFGEIGLGTTTSTNDSVKTEYHDNDGTENEFVSIETQEVVYACGKLYSPEQSDIDHDTTVFFGDDDSERNETVIFNESALQVPKFENVVVTPAALIEHRRIRNVKKSLKRPHSRELQGLSPVVDDRTVEDKVKRRLVFDQLENKTSSYDWSELHTKCPTSYTSDIFDYLGFIENKPRGVPHIASITRACIINWLMKLNGRNGNPAVIESACWYMDSYLKIKEVPLLKLQVAAAACYWIAQKLHGAWFSAQKLVLCANNGFSVELLRAAEMKVLRDLGFPPQPVIPQEFITYLSWWCDNQHPEEIEMGATFLCMAGLMVDKSLCEEFPSVIAAAAVKTAVLLLGKIAYMDRLIMCPVYQKSLIKVPSIQPLSSIFCRAVRTISSPVYEYNLLLEHYGQPPKCIARKITEAAKWCGYEPQHNRKSVSYKLI